VTETPARIDMSVGEERDVELPGLETAGTEPSRTGAPATQASRMSSGTAVTEGLDTMKNPDGWLPTGLVGSGPHTRLTSQRSCSSGCTALQIRLPIVVQSCSAPRS
jgi:hypothetical protein